jgi:thioredoxin 2
MTRRNTKPQIRDTGPRDDIAGSRLGLQCLSQFRHPNPPTDVIGSVETIMSNIRHIVCPHCDSINRVPADKPANKAKCGRCQKALFTGGPITVSAKSFTAQIRRNDIPVVVDFWAAWCQPCKAMAPAYESVAAELEPDMRFLKVDTEAEQELAAQYNIRSIPTLMVFCNGAVIGQRAGALDAQTLRSWLRQYVPAQAGSA